jgi:predicted transposase/invertase (TIGR01784 family)
MQYTEFKETNIMLQDRILTYSEEAEKRGIEKGEKRAEKREREKAMKEKLQAARKMKAAGITPEQIREFINLSAEEIRRV